MEESLAEGARVQIDTHDATFWIQVDPRAERVHLIHRERLLVRKVVKVGQVRFQGLRHILTGAVAQAKVGEGFQYLTGPRFRRRVEAIVEGLSSMQDDLDKERKAITKQWAKRPCAGGYGWDARGLAGNCGQVHPGNRRAGTEGFECRGRRVMLQNHPPNGWFTRFRFSIPKTLAFLPLNQLSGGGQMATGFEPVGVRLLTGREHAAYRNRCPRSHLAL